MSKRPRTSRPSGKVAANKKKKLQNTPAKMSPGRKRKNVSISPNLEQSGKKNDGNFASAVHAKMFIASELQKSLPKFEPFNGVDAPQKSEKLRTFEMLLSPKIFESLVQDRVNGLKDVSTRISSQKRSPKKNKSAYLLFSAETRKDLKESSPELSFVDISKKIGAIWKALSDDEKKEWNTKNHAESKNQGSQATDSGNNDSTATATATATATVTTKAKKKKAAQNDPEFVPGPEEKATEGKDSVQPDNQPVCVEFRSIKAFESVFGPHCSRRVCSGGLTMLGHRSLTIQMVVPITVGYSTADRKLSVCYMCSSSYKYRNEE